MAECNQLTFLPFKGLRRPEYWDFGRVCCGFWFYCRS